MLPVINAEQYSNDTRCYIIVYPINAVTSCTNFVFAASIVPFPRGKLAMVALNFP